MASADEGVAVGRREQFLVYGYADPRVGCGVHLLLRCEGCGLPVAQPLGLRDALPEHYGRKLAQALLFDAPVGYDTLQVRKSTLAEVPQHVQGAYVTLDVGADLDDVGIAEYREQGVVGFMRHRRMR